MGEGPDGPAPTPSRQGEGGGEGGGKGSKAQGGKGKIENCMTLASSYTVRKGDPCRHSDSSTPPSASQGPRSWNGVRSKRVLPPDLLLKDASFLFFAWLWECWLWWCGRFHSRHSRPGFAAWRCAQFDSRARATYPVHRH